MIKWKKVNFLINLNISERFFEFYEIILKNWGLFYFFYLSIIDKNIKNLKYLLFSK